MYELLKQLCKEKGTTVTQLCILVTGNSGNLATWKKGYMRSDYLAKTSEILGVSADYLLGLSNQRESSHISNSGNFVNGNNSNSPLTIGKAEQPEDEMQKEISSVLSGLSFRERTELMTMIYKFADEHKKG